MNSGQPSFQTRHLSPARLPVVADAGGLPLTCVVRHGRAAEAPSHTHDYGQLIYPELGGLMLETGNRVVRLAPDRAAWIPGGVPHAVLIDRTFRYHSVYIDAAFFRSDAFFVLGVRPLLKEIIVEMSRWSSTPGDVARRGRLAAVLVDELGQNVVQGAGLPSGTDMPADRRIAAICRAIERNPGDARSLPEWALEVGASAKTIQRLFHAETDMSFQQWRNKVRMTHAVELHAQGMRLLDIAVAIGYATEGAYAQAFKKFYGYPPSRLQMHSTSTR